MILQQTNQSIFAASEDPLGLSCGCVLHSPGTLNFLHIYVCSAPLGTRVWVMLGPLRSVPLLAILSLPRRAGDNNPPTMGHWQHLWPLPAGSAPGLARASAVTSEHRISESPDMVWREGCPGLSPEKQQKIDQNVVCSEGRIRMTGFFFCFLNFS